VKRTMMVLAAVCLVLALVLPAGAKGAAPQSANMSGPGLGTPMTFGDPASPGGTSADGNVVLLANETQLFPTLYEGDLIGGAPPADKLGPRYTITWTLRRELHPGETFQIRSNFYPYAEGGPVMHTFGGQKVRETGGSFVLRSGWSAANPVIVDNLQAWGMPKEHQEVEATTTSSASTPLWLIPLGALVLIVAAVLGTRRRSGRTATA
jgi:hypothetical protein